MDPIREYHDILADSDIAQASHEALDRQLTARNLVFGGRPLCTVLRPKFFTVEQLRLLESRIRRLMAAFRVAHEAAMTDATLRTQFRLTDWEEQLVMDDPGYRTASPHGRLDCFGNSQGGLALTEYNAETPAGAGFNDLLMEAFQTIPVMRRFGHKYSARPLPGRPGVGTVILDAWHEFSGGWNRPRIAIVDWSDVPSRVEFDIFKAYFESIGLETEIVDPRAMEYRGGKLYGAAGPVDLIYKRVLINELIEREGMNHPVVRAVRERAVCMVNPFRCKLLHKKASLAVLSDERNARLFNADMTSAIGDHIPWTRVVEERNTGFEGRTVDLLPFIAENRQRLVLKPNDDYGGAGVILGWTVDDATWATELKKAIAEPYIVQDRVEIPSEPFPSLVDGQVQLVDRMYDTAPFVLHGDVVDGCLNRLSTAALLNVTAGGGSTVPSFVVEPRS
jgi:glutathionylspermidine synthase